MDKYKPFDRTDAKNSNEFHICNNYSNIIKNNFKGGEGRYMAMT